MRTDSILINKPGTIEHTGPEQARLNNKPSSGESESGSGSGSESGSGESESGSGSETSEKTAGAGAWEPKDIEGYLEIEFNQVERVREIKTQGFPSGDKYVSNYFVYYTKDGKYWKRYQNVSTIRRVKAHPYC